MKIKAKCVVHKIRAGSWVGYDAAGTHEAEGHTRREVEKLLREALGACDFKRGDDLTDEEWSAISEVDDEEGGESEAPDELPEPVGVGASEPAPGPHAASGGGERDAKAEHFRALCASSHADRTIADWDYISKYAARGPDAVELPGTAPPPPAKKRG